MRHPARGVSIRVMTRTCLVLLLVAASAQAAAAKDTKEPDDLLSLVSGVMIVDGPGGLEPTAREFAMFDQDPRSGWIQEEDKVLGHPIVVQLPSRVRIKKLVVDEGKCDLDSRLVHSFSIEVSDKSATEGFKRIALVKPTRQQDGLVFPVTADVPGRWVRIVSLPRKSPDEGVSETQIMNLHAYGERLEPVVMPQVTGTYETDLGDMYFTQDGAQVTGCAYRAIKPFSGVLEGRVLRVQWERDPDHLHGPLVITFGDGGVMFGSFWNETIENPSLEPQWGKRVSTTPGACPKPDKDPLGKQLADQGRVRLYGILFDLDSDKLRPESKPTLEQIVSTLKASPDLKVRIEGHTDDTGKADHNQKLSDARAASVKAYLVAAGIAAARLETKGFGSTKPAVPNSSDMARAANRRVELVKL